MKNDKNRSDHRIFRFRENNVFKEYASYLITQGQNIGILENDFGAVNVDMMLLGDLRGDNCELEMISGGCDTDTHRRRFRPN